MQEIWREIWRHHTYFICARHVTAYDAGMARSARVVVPGAAYHITQWGNFLRCLALPKTVKDWSLRTLKEKLLKIGAKVVRSRFIGIIFQMAEVAVPRAKSARRTRHTNGGQAADKYLDSRPRTTMRGGNDKGIFDLRF